MSNKFVLLTLLCLLWCASGIAGTAQYTYDNLNRLVQVQYDDGTTIQYSYDAAGNRLVKQVTAGDLSSIANEVEPPFRVAGNQVLRR